MILEKMFVIIIHHLSTWFNIMKKISILTRKDEREYGAVIIINNIFSILWTQRRLHISERWWVWWLVAQTYNTTVNVGSSCQYCHQLFSQDDQQLLSLQVNVNANALQCIETCNWLDMKKMVGDLLDKLL